MRRLLTSLTVTLGLALGLVAPLSLASAPVYAESSKQAACAGIGLTTPGSSDCATAGADAKVSSIIASVVSILSVIVGVAAVIMIIVSGFKYVTSGGDANKVSSAKTGLVYAIIGLIIVALAQFIVHFVLDSV